MSAHNQTYHTSYTTEIYPATCMPAYNKTYHTSQTIGIYPATCIPACNQTYHTHSRQINTLWNQNQTFGIDVTIAYQHTIRDRLYLPHERCVPSHMHATPQSDVSHFPHYRYIFVHSASL
jgi:hypothetical protein